MADSNKYVPISGNSNLAISVSDNSTATAFSSDVTVNSLASQQTLQFSGSSPYTSPTASIGQGTLTLNLGTWNVSGNSFTNKSTPVTHTVTVDANNNTLQDMGDSSFSETRFDGAGFGLGFSVIIDQVRSAIPASMGSYSWGGMASTFFWIDPKEELFSILLTQLIPSGRYPIRPQAQTLVYAAINNLNKKN